MCYFYDATKFCTYSPGAAPLLYVRVWAKKNSKCLIEFSMHRTHTYVILNKIIYKNRQRPVGIVAAFYSRFVYRYTTTTVIGCHDDTQHIDGLITLNFVEQIDICVAFCCTMHRNPQHNAYIETYTHVINAF